MRRLVAVALMLAGCATLPRPQCQLGPLPQWHGVQIRPLPDGSAELAPADAAVLASDVNALRDWAEQAQACVGPGG